MNSVYFLPCPFDKILLSNNFNDSHKNIIVLTPEKLLFGIIVIKNHFLTLMKHIISGS